MPEVGYELGRKGTNKLAVYSQSINSPKATKLRKGHKKEKAPATGVLTAHPRAKRFLLL